MPAALLLQREDATVTIIHSKTKNPEELIRQADIILSAAGQPNLVRGSWIKPGAIVTNVGFSLDKDPNAPFGFRVVGDICYEEVCKVASAITPAPSGPFLLISLAMLLSNNLTSAKRIHNFM
ncbi:NAD(P)-binding domain superfamily [Arabidopsis thaliana x Arabidopsis arenosa]|uniref:NAD(P)-binding domain superfamily n=1 Tax=Arabidopsis thaliana x Arabidopsis arenosa TaxID=1240361 RepID=A0A8T1Z2S0_9BRAS|nr:NAD(P)-binding domain superfamily [Arabidopsis thaliana x Arabidopsis arenosa]